MGEEGTMVALEGRMLALMEARCWAPEIYYSPLTAVERQHCSCESEKKQPVHTSMILDPDTFVMHG